ncbi:hypothetical protein GGH96_000370 [Coemansia sp. RSA 1972]|nr:hypothetical protein GGH96_000370 [Coemansia sp. RSA 1972]
MYKIAFFFVVLTHAHALTVAQYFFTVFINIVLHFANMALASVSAKIATGLQQRLDAQAIKCQKLEYMRALAYKERNIKKLNEKLLAVYDDCDNKSKNNTSLKYYEEQY